MTMICPACTTPNDSTNLVCAVCGTSLQATATEKSSGIYLPVGAQLKQGEFEIKSLLGEGGFGVTYKADHKSTNKIVAIKELLPERSARNGNEIIWSHLIPPAERRKFINELRNEYQRTLGLSHPNIANAIDLFEENNTVYLVLDFIEGKTLAQIFKENGCIQESQARLYLKSICYALDCIHASKILHLDIKPENIIINTNNEPVLIDLGSAREFTIDQTKRYTRLLTEDYAPYEQRLEHTKLGPYTDIYALCVTFYQALVGTLPPNAVSRVREDTLPSPRSIKPELSPLIERILLEGLQINLQQRFQSATEIIDELENKPRLLRKAREAARQGAFSQSIELYTKTIAENPESTTARLELAYLHIRNDPAATLAVAAPILKIDPTCGEAYGLIGTAQCQLKSWKQAIKSLISGVKLSPELAWIRLNLAYALSEEGQYDQAKLVLDPVSQCTPNAQSTLALQALLAFKMGEWSNTIRYTRQALRSTNQDVGYIDQPREKITPILTFAIQKATSYTSPDMLSLIQELKQSCPKNTLTLALHLWQVLASKNHEEASAVISSITQLDSYDSLSKFNLAIAQLCLKNIDAAINVAKEIKDANSLGWQAYILLGNLYIHKQLWKEAKESFNFAIKMGCDDPKVFHTLGWTLLNIRRLKDSNEDASLMLSVYRKAYLGYLARGDTSLAHTIANQFSKVGVSL